MFIRLLRWAVLFFTASVLLVCIASCSESSNPAGARDTQEDVPSAALVELDVLEDQGVRVELYGPPVLQTGYISFLVKLADMASDEYLRGAEVEIHPLMQMETDGGTVMHGTPSEFPAVHNSEDGSYVNPVVLLMPGTWQLQVSYKHGGREGDMVLAVEVGRGGRLATLAGEDGKNYVVALVTPHRPIVGKQDLEVAVYLQESMMSFPPVSDLEIAMEPFMPSMNHGSPDNEAPILIDNGHYIGKVNFIMSGDWRIDLTLSNGAGPIAQTSFTLVVE